MSAIVRIAAIAIIAKIAKIEKWDALSLVGGLGRPQFGFQVGGDLGSVKAAVFDEDLAGSRSRHDHSGNVDSRNITLKSLRIAHRTHLRFLQLYAQ